MGDEWKSNALGLIGIAVSIIAFVNKEDQLLVYLVFASAIVFYIINNMSESINEYDEKIRKLEEKLKIHSQLIDLKADVEYLKKQVSKK